MQDMKRENMFPALGAIFCLDIEIIGCGLWVLFFIVVLGFCFVLFCLHFINEYERSRRYT